VIPKKRKGFTLVELLVVLLIVGVLAALGLPQFMKTKEQAIGREAITNLKLIAAAQRIYRLELSNNFYPYPANTQDNINEINEKLKLYITEGNWNYTVTSTGTPTTSNFTSTAVRASGIYANNCTYTINNGLEDPEPTNCP
jgi:prepilin-type N-terminal cleavage/methylation domain-containing protein